MDYIGELKEAIRKLHGCEAEHVETVPVTETFQGQTVWQGEVEVFDLLACPHASRAYAWAHETEDADKRRHITVLHVPPVVSPQTAVRAAIIQQYRQEHGTEEN
jgi:hypothetical protein